MHPIVDAHSDLLAELVHAEQALGERNPFRSRWLGPLRAGGVGLQVCALYADPELAPPAGLRQALRQVRSFHAAVAANPDAVFAVRAATDLDAVDGSRIGLVLALEGASCLGEDVWLIDVLHALGLRMASLTWNERNAFAGGCDHREGLTELGVQMVRRMSQLGIVIDLAHASPRTVTDVLGIIDDSPVLVSHAACRAVRDHPRNLTDDQLRAVARHDGVVGLMPDALVIDIERPTLSRFVDHIDHAVETMGIDHVALGGDFLRQIARALGEDVPPDLGLDELEGPQDYPALTAELRTRSYEDAHIDKLRGGNALRVLRRSLGG